MPRRFFLDLKSTVDGDINFRACFVNGEQTEIELNDSTQNKKIKFSL